MVFDFGIRLRELRRRKKMTQAQVAKRPESFQNRCQRL